MTKTTTRNETQRAIAAVRRMYPKAHDLFAFPTPDCVYVLIRKGPVVKTIRYENLDSSEKKVVATYHRLAAKI
jgi:hypothetical protein